MDVPREKEAVLIKTYLHMFAGILEFQKSKTDTILQLKLSTVWKKKLN